MRKTLWLALVGSLALWGLSFSLMKIILDEGVGPMTMALVRFGITLPFIFLFALMIKDRGPFFSLDVMPAATTVALFAVVLANLFQNYGLQYTTAGMASVLQEMAPLFTIILAVRILRERVNRYIIGGALISFSATVVLFYDPAGGSMFGNALMVMTALMYAVSSLTSKKALATTHPVTFTIMVHSIGLLILLPITLAFEIHEVADVPAWSGTAWMAIVLLAILPTALGPIIWYYAMRETTLSSLSILTYLIPAFAIIFDMLLTGTFMTPLHLVLGAVLVTGVVIAQKGSTIAELEHGQQYHMKVPHEDDE